MAKFTKETAKHFGSKGGHRKAEVQKLKRTAKEIVNQLLDSTSSGILTYKDELIEELLKLGLKGDLNAIKYIFELAGEAPSQAIEVTGKDGTPLNEPKKLSKTEIKMLIKELQDEF